MALRERIAERRERRGNSESLRQFRRMRMLSELMRAHRRMEEPKTIGQLLAEEARAQLQKAGEFFKGVSLPL